MKKQIWLIIIFAIIIIVLAGVLLLPNNKPANNNQQKNPVVVEGIQISFPKENGTISSPLKIIGTVNGAGWAGFEGQVGTVELLDNKGNKIASSILKATTDWTKPPVSFESDLVFQTKITGNATLLFSNENPSGIPDKDKKFGLPVIVK